jgi:hypothetical protein
MTKELQLLPELRMATAVIWKQLGFRLAHFMYCFLCRLIKGFLVVVMREIFWQLGFTQHVLTTKQFRLYARSYWSLVKRKRSSLVTQDFCSLKLCHHLGNSAFFYVECQVILCVFLLQTKLGWKGARGFGNWGFFDDTTMTSQSKSIAYTSILNCLSAVWGRGFESLCWRTLKGDGQCLFLYKEPRHCFEELGTKCSFVFDVVFSFSRIIDNSI